MKKKRTIRNTFPSFKIFAVNFFSLCIATWAIRHTMSLFRSVWFGNQAIFRCESKCFMIPILQQIYFIELKLSLIFMFPLYG